MSEIDPLHDLKRTYHQLSFIHQVLTQKSQYFVEEFEIAKDAAEMITKMANALADDIKAKEAPVSEGANV